VNDAEIFPKVYWKPKNSSQMWLAQGIQPLNTPAGTPLLGGQSFAPDKHSKIWEKFPHTFFFNPNNYNCIPWIADPLCSLFPRHQVLHRADLPTFKKWKNLVEDSIEKIKKGYLKKVVLARQTTLTCTEKIDPIQIFKSLYKIGKKNSLFFFQTDKTTAFLGATPEKLFHRKESFIITEALAGTILKSQKWTPKESSEIRIVQDFLKEKLEFLCTGFRSYPMKKKTFNNLYHLHQIIKGNLKDGFSDHDLIAHLHPTPALGGFPQAAALDYIMQNEPFARGWYGGPFGMITEQESFIAVAIRSALIQGSQIHLFSGAGIVEDSNPEQEWEELNQKISFYVNLFSSI
jgi:menaquinone-specific isochorismate synthase